MISNYPGILGEEDPYEAIELGQKIFALY